MGIFDFFKKKDVRRYDATDVRVVDMEEGYVFDYDLSTWTVSKTYIYDWGDNFFSKDHKITNGKDTYYLSVCDDDELEISLLTKVRISSFEVDIPHYIKENEEPPRRITYEGVDYTRESGEAGYINEGDDWEEMMSWTYYDIDNKRILCIEQFDEDEFEASYGKLIKEYEISNILPGNRN
ncbi:DUF4178 domain-containing protein [Marinilabiliaceae bacterium JC040]|jgi:hypothetical protein|nr:DUF4178 domain-containing protein [Marinilabiliaceae bacterium JC040]